MSSREEKKAEAELKALLKLPANKRCINCEAMGPQYVVCAFNVFVCTVCSGVHRQFGHRVKGVSMSTFKQDEVAALRDSGNEKFTAFFLNKWTAAALPKPVEREAPRIHSWISAVYQDRRFYAEPAGGWTPGAAAAAAAGSAGGRMTSEGEPAVRPMADVLGGATPKLQVQHSGGSKQLERSVSAASSSAGAAAAATPTRSGSTSAQPAASSSAAAAPVNLLDVSSPKSARSAPPGALPAGAAAAAPAWDPFGSPKAPAAAAAAAAAASPAAAARTSPRSASAPPEAGWASFGDAPAPAAAPAAVEQHKQPQNTQPVSAVAPAAEGTSAGGWEAFGDGPTPAPEPAAPAEAAAAQAAAAPSAPAAGSPAGKPPKQPVQSSSRAEVPMDVFYPEFEQIRATGILPTGQPVPLPAFPPSYGGAAPRPGSAHHPPAPLYGSAAPYGYHHHPPGAPPTAAAAQQARGGYGAPGAPPRPTIAIPPAPLHPGAGYYAPSPAGFPGMPSPGPGAHSSPSGYSSGPSPAGSGYSSALSAANGGYGHGGMSASGSGGFGDLRSSTGSLGDGMGMPAGSAAPTPAAQHDPFAGLAPGLRSALPAVPAAAGAGKWGGVAPPPPTPAGGAVPPPYANGSGAAAAQLPYTSQPFSAPLPSPAGVAPAAAAATATLFGRTPSLTGYDLSAPAAPKPQASGNPFA